MIEVIRADGQADAAELGIHGLDVFGSAAVVEVLGQLRQGADLPVLEHNPAGAVNDDRGVIDLIPILLQATGRDPHLVLPGERGKEVGVFPRDGQGIPAGLLVQPTPIGGFRQVEEIGLLLGRLSGCLLSQAHVLLQVAILDRELRQGHTQARVRMPQRLSRVRLGGCRTE